MGLTTLAVPAVPAVPDVSQVSDQADESVREERPACAETRAKDLADDTPGANDAEVDDELDRLDNLGDEIATLAAHLHAGTYRLLT